jgi:hypothetical protein
MEPGKSWEQRGVGMGGGAGGVVVDGGCGDFGFSESADLRTHVKQGRKHGDLVHGQSSFLCTRDNLVVVERNTGPVCGGKGKGLEWSGKEGKGVGQFFGAFPSVGNQIELWLTWAVQHPLRCPHSSRHRTVFRNML